VIDRDHALALLALPPHPPDEPWPLPEHLGHVIDFEGADVRVDFDPQPSKLFWLCGCHRH
jgi:hypothetical protein